MGRAIAGNPQPLLIASRREIQRLKSRLYTHENNTGDYNSVTRRSPAPVQNVADLKRNIFAGRKPCFLITNGFSHLYDEPHPLEILPLFKRILLNRQPVRKASVSTTLNLSEPLLRLSPPAKIYNRQHSPSTRTSPKQWAKTRILRIIYPGPSYPIMDARYTVALASGSLSPPRDTPPHPTEKTRTSPIPHIIGVRSEKTSPTSNNRNKSAL
jgi:hypothetical protein